jgi:hypothetical protein
MTTKATPAKKTSVKKISKRKAAAPAESAAPAKTDGKSKRQNGGKQAKPRVDPMESIWKSRERDRQDMLQTQRELREMMQDSQLRILAMRTKGNLARLKLVNKSFDD